MKILTSDNFLLIIALLLIVGSSFFIFSYYITTEVTSCTSDTAQYIATHSDITNTIGLPITKVVITFYSGDIYIDEETYTFNLN